MLFSPLCNFEFFIKIGDQRCMDLGHIFNSMLLNIISVFVPVPCCFYYYCSVIELEIWGGDTARSSFLFRFVSLSWNICVSLRGLRFFPISVANCVRILIGIVLNLHITFKRIVIFIILIFVFHEHTILSYVFNSFV